MEKHCRTKDFSLYPALGITPAAGLKSMEKNLILLNLLKKHVSGEVYQRLSCSIIFSLEHLSVFG